MTNVLLVVLDSVRARNCSLYDHVNETTPFLSSLSSESVVYSQARAPGIWSLPSHASMFTGYHVEEHGLTTRDAQIEAGHTIWETLRDEEGYETAAFTRNPFVTRDAYGLNAGFETIRSSLATRSYPFPSATNPIEFTEDVASSRSEARQYLDHCLSHEQPVRSLVNGAVQKIDTRFPNRLPSFLRPYHTNSAERYTETFLQWQREQDGPWAACLNLMDAHDPYLPEREFDRWADEGLRRIQDDLDDHRWDFYSGRKPWWQRTALQALYDGCIRQLDESLSHLVGTLEKRGVLDDTLLIVTSDHGEGFGERSRVRPSFRVVGHNGGIHEALLHVPLLVRYPEQKHEGVVDAPATLTRLPAVVRRTIAGESDRDDFVPDGPVLAAADHDSRYSGSVSSLEGYRSEIDLSLFTGMARATYTATDEYVEKQLSWGDENAIVACRDAQDSMRLSTRAGDQLATVQDHLEDRSVLVDSSTVDDQTKRHLQELGYA